MSRYRCTCTTAAAGSCAGDTTFDPRTERGCGCVCHGLYEDDPANWQPFSVALFTFPDELAGMVDLEARLDAAEALTEDSDV